MCSSQWAAQKEWEDALCLCKASFGRPMKGISGCTGVLRVTVFGIAKGVSCDMRHIPGGVRRMKHCVSKGIFTALGVHLLL